MGTPLLPALAALLVLITLPASRDLFKTLRERNKRDGKTRLVPIRVDDGRTRRSRDTHGH